MSFKLPDLPYERNALEPHISAQTMDLHYGKHHKAYVDKLNGLVEGTPMEEMSLVDIISSAREQSQIGIFNNAAQSWNHDFLWKSMSPDGGNEPDGRIADLVESEFGDIDAFKKAFKESALGQFGSGWTWLVLDGSRVRIVSTSNAETPVGTHLTPLLTLDVWEHAYYVDYKNERNRYVDAFLDKLINWKFAAENLEEVQQAA